MFIAEEIGDEESVVPAITSIREDLVASKIGKRRKSEKDSHILARIDRLIEIGNDCKEEKEIDRHTKYSEYLEAEFRNLHDERKEAFIKHEISSLFLKAKFGMLENSFNPIQDSASTSNQFQGSASTSNSLNQFQGSASTSNSLNQFQGSVSTSNSLNQFQGSALTSNSLNQFQGSALTSNSLNQFQGSVSTSNLFNQFQGSGSTSNSFNPNPWHVIP